MEVHGIDMTREAYRISAPVDGTEVAGFVPESLVMEMLGLKRRPGHGEVYRWLEKYQGQVLAALKVQHIGNGSPKAPFDRIPLAEGA